MGKVYLPRIPYPMTEKASETNILLSLSVAIKNGRQAKGFSPDAFARLCKTDKAAISRIEAGKSNITLQTLNSLATVLGIPVAGLLLPERKTL